MPRVAGKKLWVVFVLSAAAGQAAHAGETALAGGLRPVDDSYTVSQRYDAYREQYPQFQWPKVTFQAGQQVLFDRRYKTVGQRELHIDIFLPAAGQATRKAIVLVHGGGWRSGNKSNFYAIANLLAQRGHAVFLPEFRLSPEAAYPAALRDLNDAIVWVKAQAKEYDVDADQVSIGGESTGGHLAALLAYTADRPLFKSHPTDDAHVAALFDIDGILDLTTTEALRYENAGGPRSPAAQWLGGAMEHARARWQEASPARYIDAQSPPTLVIGSSESRYTAGREEVEPALRRLGIRFQYTSFDNTPHTFWLFDPYAGKVVELIDAFLRGSR